MAAYFDSPKNKAMWNRELEELRAERKTRTENPGPACKSPAGDPQARPIRELITYEQLLAATSEMNRSARKYSPDASFREIAKTGFRL